MNKEFEVLNILKDNGILKGIADAVDSEVIKQNYTLKCELFMERNKHGLGYDAYKKILHSIRRGETFCQSAFSIGRGNGYHVLDTKSMKELMEDREKLKKIREVQ